MASDEITPSKAAPLLAAGRLLAERGGYGLVWLDPGLVVTARYGRLVDFVEIGEPVTDALLPLIGLEAEIRALAGNADAVVELPAVAIHLPGREIPRLNITALSTGSGETLLLVSRAITRADLEAQLAAHMRARLIAESELRAKSRALALANRDLEDFAAIISHDLLAPLRAMRKLTDDARGDILRSADEQALSRLDDIASQSSRMSRMLRELLDYASVGRKDEVVAEVDTRRLIEDIVRSIPRPEGIALRIEGHWPRLEVAGAALDLALRNLVANAVKHHDGPPGLVTVSAAEGEGCVSFAVADDGPGIDPRYHEAILLPFRTLAAPDRAAGGSGLGLAFVKRAAEAMGARFEVRSDPMSRRGATFVLTVPRRRSRPSAGDD
ncbi:MAG: HAMP domain-containing sensor histidine kinase [Pseudomonadota bacterium]